MQQLACRKQYTLPGSTLGIGCNSVQCLRAVMDVGLPAEQREAICAAHRAATKQQLYDSDCYMASNPQEYFAEGTQVRLDAVPGGCIGVDDLASGMTPCKHRLAIPAGLV